MRDEKNSMLYWFPKVEELDIPTPKTEIIKVTPSWDKSGNYLFVKEKEFKEIKKIANKFGYPVFIRTDQFSGKHDWEDTCYVESNKDLRQHINNLLMASSGADILGLPTRAIAVREFILMDSKYTAFIGNMPVSPERRYFIEKGKILCHHPYWIKKAIFFPSTKNWEGLSDKMNKETKEEVKLLTEYAKKIGEIFKEFWSVDFCRAKDGTWYFIDMAEGERSWHPKNCPNNRTPKNSEAGTQKRGKSRKLSLNYKKIFASKEGQGVGKRPQGVGKKTSKAGTKAEKEIICVICGEHGNEIPCVEYQQKKGYNSAIDKVITEVERLEKKGINCYGCIRNILEALRK